MRGIERIIFTCALFAGFLIFALAQESNGEPVKLIIDTDFGPDCDDAGALAVAHYLMGIGKTEIIGVITSTNGHPVVPAIDVVNHYYGRPDIPIGLAGPNGVKIESDWTSHLRDHFPYQKTNESVPHSTELYRQLIYEADQPVRIAVIGFQSMLSLFLDSEADHRGDGIPYSGMELVEQKVEKLIIMGGDFANPDHAEWNIIKDIPSAQNIVKNWPGDIIFSGYEVGLDVLSGGALTNPINNPVAMAYKESHRTIPRSGSGTISDNHSWDHCAIFQAICGNYKCYGDDGEAERFWRLSEYGTITVRDNGSTSHKVHDGGKHRYQVEDKDPNEIGTVFDQMMTWEP